MLIICDHKDECSDGHCPWRRPKLHGGEMINANCSTVGKYVSVLEVFKLSKNDPNYEFKRRKRDGL